MTDTPSVPRPATQCIDCGKPAHHHARCTIHARAHAAKHNQNTAYYRTSQWRALRRYVVTRDHNQCIHCATRTGRLIVHHITPRKAIGTAADTPTNLVTLCHSCHSRLETGDTLIHTSITTYMRTLR